MAGAPSDSWLPLAILPVVVFALVVVTGLLAGVFEYDPDEGLNLMKASLVARGHALYREIWSDQPPLHTLILAGVFGWTGPSALAGRVLTAAFSALLVTSLYDVVRTLVSRRAGLVAAGLLLASSWYAKLSFSVMIGLPSQALAMASLSPLLRVGAPRRSAVSSWALLVLSALLMCAAIAVKLFAVLVIVPGVLVLATRLAERGWAPRDVVATIAVWLLVIVGSAAVVTAAMRLPLGDLLWPHLTVSHGKPWGATPNVQHLMRRDPDLLLLSFAALGMALFATGRRRRDVLVPVFWFVAAVVVVQLDEPAWYHHSLLLTVPAAWASAAVLEAVLRRRTRWRQLGMASRALCVGLLVGGFAAWQGVKLVTSVGRMFVAAGAHDRAVLEEMRRRAPQTTWVVADRPMLPFAAGLVVPPELAVMSVKRREAGTLSDEIVVRLLERYRPEQIVTGRIAFGPAVMDHVHAHYRCVQKRTPGDPAKLFVRRDLLESSAP